MIQRMKGGYYAKVVEKTTRYKSIHCMAAEQLIDFRMGRKNMMTRCSFLLLALLLQIKPRDAADATSDTIVLGASLTGNETRISKGGIFQLGFFNLNNSNVKHWYVGIWYANISPQTIAWVANREQPLQNTSGVFNLTDDGSLLLSYGGSAVWSSKGNGKKPSSAVIMDTGNLVVLSAENTSIWESFDQPGNTWLPGMKISTNQRQTSWRKPWDPTPGPFALQMDPNGTDQFVLMWENHTTYWKSGIWNGKFFPQTADMATGSLFDYTYFSNGSYKYFTYFYIKNGLTFLSRGVMERSGEMRIYIMLDNKHWSMVWQRPLTQCEVYAVCGPYGSCNNNNVQPCNCVTGFIPRDSREWESQQWSSGCVRKTPLRCSHAGNRTTTDGFVELRGKSWLPEGFPYKGKGQGQCQEACLANCSCTAYAYVLNSTSQTCVLWFGELLNLYDSSNGISLFLRLDASDVPHSSNSKKKATLAGTMGGILGGLVAIFVLVLLFLWCCRRWRSSATEYAPGTLTVFSYRELQIATKNFSERLGGGGFGSVFKGNLTDGSLVAVKKLESVSQGEKQFRMEVSTIGTTQHVNLVRLRGFCTEGSRRLLVYEYMPNGSLNSFLFHTTQSDGDDQIQKKVLDWKTRFGIAVGTARGIVYLHDKCRDCIIHCDIKPENILLDSNFCPKVADFGLAKLLGREYSKVLTTMRGTRGYLAPEWLSGLPITVKADVYSFGMTLLEIIAGRRNMDRVSESGELFFPAWAATQISSGNAMEVLDKKLMNVNDVEAEQVKRAAIVGGWCIQDDEDTRPSMSEVVQVLEGLVDVPPLPPLPLSLKFLALKADSLVFFWDKDSSAHSNNNDNPSTTL